MTLNSAKTLEIVKDLENRASMQRSMNPLYLNEMRERVLNILDDEGTE